MSNTVLLSDGTTVTLYGHSSGPQGAGPRGRNGAIIPMDAPNYWLEVITSTDGGETLTNAYKISDYYMNRPRSEGAVIPHLAVDPGSPLFKDRLYVVWSDFRTNRLEIMFTYSSDKGRTWSQPIVVSDDRASANPLTEGPDNMTPTVAVNKDGVVAVTWYDRRDFADDLSWNLRFRASLDGGETWGPSVKVTDQPTQFATNEQWVIPASLSSPRGGPPGGGRGGGGRGGGRGGGGGGADSVRSGGRFVSLNANISNASFTFAPGHNGAFVADAAGAFHPMWIDYRTGYAQVWTAPVTVEGKVARNGGGTLADLEDVSTRVSLQTVTTSYDRQTNRLTFHTRLKNLTKTDTIHGPIKARVISIRSDIAKTVEILNADNQLRGEGAVWDLSSLIPPGGLLPDAESSQKDLVVQLSNLLPFRQGGLVKNNVANLQTRLLGVPAPARARSSATREP